MKNTVRKLQKETLHFLPIGKKGYEHFTKNGFPVVDNYWDIFTGLSFEKVQAAAKFAMNGFANNEFDAVELVYSEFKNAATQLFVDEQFYRYQK
ncbi:MAG: F0F1 ATP synthase subunit gamma [Ferruginibacter sp.]